MSESEQKGRCRSEVDRSGSGGPVTNAIADAIDRLAADVAAVKEAVCGNCPKKLDSSPAAPQPAAVSDAQPAAGWLTAEERSVLKSHAKSLREQRFALERGGQTLGYSANPGSLKREADLIDALLSRAGSPPVVEVPELPSNHYARSEAERYRVAIDAAGVSWKEVGRE